MWQVEEATWPVVQLKLDFEHEQFLQLIRRAHQYAAVEYQGITVHQWVTDLEKIGNQFMGEEESSDEPARDSIFMALPSKDTIIVSPSLALLTKAVDQNLAKTTKAPVHLIAERFGGGTNLVTLHSRGARDQFPGEIIAVVRENDAGALNVLAHIPCNSMTKAAAKSINDILNSPETAANMLAAMNPGDADEKQVPDNTNGDRNQISLSVSFDSKGFGHEELPDTIQTLLTKCISCEYVDDVLKLEATFFAGRPDIIFTPRTTSNQTDGPIAGVNSLVARLNAYSSAELRDMAIRIADAPKVDTPPHTNLRR